MEEQVHIRKGTINDMEAVHALIQELAAYEKALDEVEVSVEELKADGFGEQPAFEVLVATMQEKVVGFALYYTSYSTWKGKCIYLEDFLVNAEYRRFGIGKKLFQAVVDEGVRRKCRRMDWQVLDWNEPAINFYKKWGASLEPEWLNGRLYEQDLARLGAK